MHRTAERGAKTVAVLQKPEKFLQQKSAVTGTLSSRRDWLRTLRIKGKQA